MSNSNITPRVLVLGGSGFIGTAICIKFAKQGWDVGIHYHTRYEDAHTTLNAIENLGQQGYIFKADVGNHNDVQTLFEQTHGTWQTINALIWSVGYTVNRLTIWLTPKQWDDIIHTNLTGLFLCMQHGIKLFPKQYGGSITVLSSLSGIAGQTGQTAYAACKSGALGLVKSAAQEWGDDNIRVNAVFPGWQPSTLAGNTFPTHNELHAHELGRTPSLDDVTNTIYQLTTAKDVSGQVYSIDNRIW